LERPQPKLGQNRPTFRPNFSFCSSTHCGDDVTAKPRIVCWFSCGVASAVATKLVLSKLGDTSEITVARCLVPEEHPDNDRFADECARWFGCSITKLASLDYASCEDVWRRRKYMSGPEGAICSLEMKKVVRFLFEEEWKPDFQAFGYTIEESKRIRRFHQQNPDVRILTPLIESGLSKEDCHAIVERAGIQMPMMYRLGFIRDGA
jgi:PP-loop superfamily ATP-utilizing enzyme